MSEIPTSYVLVILLVALAGFVICRPSGRKQAMENKQAMEK